MTTRFIFVLGISMAFSACGAAGTAPNANVKSNGNAVNTSVISNSEKLNANQSAKPANTAADVEKSSTSSAATSKDDVFGYFFIKGKAPAEFQDVSFINLGGEGEYGAGANPPFYGELAKESKKGSYKLMKPEISGNNIKFKTEAVKGVSYEFDGTLKRKDLAENQPNPDDVVMTGTLKKIENGAASAESKLDFIWSVGD